jgi:hypothetical protein
MTTAPIVKEKEHRWKRFDYYPYPVYFDGGGLGDGGLHYLGHSLLGPDELEGLRDSGCAVFIFADPIE